MKPTPIIQPKIVKRVFNKEEKDCILVEIEGDEYIACDNASRNFFASQKKGNYGKGLLNTEDDPYRTERIGYLGQMAFGKLIDEPVDLVYRKGGDKQDNIIANNVKVDMKCASRNYGSNLIQKTSEYGVRQKIDKQVYVSSFLESENREEKKAEVLLVGYALKKDVLGSEVEKSPIGEHFNYKIPFEGMKPISRLIRKIKEFKNSKKES